MFDQSRALIAAGSELVAALMSKTEAISMRDSQPLGNRFRQRPVQVRTRLVWGFFCQAVVLGLLSVLCSEREGRSSFFNRAAGVKRVLSASGLRRIVVQQAGGTSLAKCCFFVRLRAVSSSRRVNRHAKRTSLRRWVRLCPGSE